MGLQVETGENPKFAVIWLHGLGADAEDFAGVPSALGLVSPTRFIFPNAAEIPVTINGGQVARAWYDIVQADSMSRVIDEAGLEATAIEVRQLIAAQIEQGIPAERIFLVGFSQGGAVAYYTALTQAQRLAGVVALSTYLPAPLLRPEATFLAPHDTPIFSAHGRHDLVVSLDFGRRAVEVLGQVGYQPEWATFPMDHSVSISEIRALGRWLNEKSLPQRAGF